MYDRITKRKKFEALLEKATNDKRVVGLVVTGARSKGIFTKHSDYDIILIGKNSTISQIRREYKGEKGILDIRIRSLSEFRKHADMGGPEEWDRYTFEHAKAQLDKTGEIQKLVDEKGVLPKKNILPVAKNALDGYLNMLHRSLKNHRDGNLFASRFDASESLQWLLTFLFAIEGRIRPYNKLLQWELERYPIRKFPMGSEKLLKKLDAVLKTGSITNQKEIYKIVFKLALKNKCKDIIKGWDGYYFG